jgi:bacterioferritin
VGSKAQAGCKTRPTEDQWSPHHESCRPEEDRRGSAETVGSREEGSREKASQKGHGRKVRKSEAGLLRCWDDGFAQISFSITCLERMNRAFWGFAIMNGNEKVITALNEALHEELTAINQYFLHSEMCENWGYEKIAKYVRKLSIVEMKYAERLIERILFLDGAPNMAAPVQLSVGNAVKQQLENDLNLEVEAVKLYNNAVKLARAEGDNGSADLFESILKDEEEHADWQETQLSLIKEIGNELYLSEQTKKE